MRSNYYSAFAYTAPRDCNDCPSCREHLDEEDANDIATFFVGGMANRVELEAQQRADLYERLHRTNRMAWWVLGAEGVR